MTVLAADNYTRADNASGWGTSTGPNSGQAWSIVTGSGWTLTSNSGRVNSTASNAFLLGSGTQGDTEGVTQSIIIDMTNGDWFGVVLRGDSLGQNQYYCTIKPELGTSNLILVRTNSNVDTSLATATITFTTNHVYAVRFRVTGNVNPRCQVRCWDTSGSEPSTWNIDFTDSNASHITGAGRYGLFGSDGTSGDIKFTSASFNDTISTVFSSVIVSDNLGPGGVLGGVYG